MNSLDPLDDNWLCVLASLPTVRDHWINCSQESFLKGRWKENKQKSHMPIQNWTCGLMQNVVLMNLEYMVLHYAF